MGMYTILMNWKTQNRKDTNLSPPIICICNTIPIIILAESFFFLDLNKLILKWKGKGVRVAETKRKKVGRTILHDFKTYYKVIKTVWYFAERKSHGSIDT
jgi:hypothetical protein